MNEKIVEQGFMVDVSSSLEGGWWIRGCFPS